MMERYLFVENIHKVSVDDRLKDYNHLVTDLWDYLEEAGFSFHGIIRKWSGIFFNQLYFAVHHFLKDQPQPECIAPDSGLSWDMIYHRDSVPGKFFSFLEQFGFRLFIPQQAMIDAMIDDGMDWHYMSPKHKFQMYCFHPKCSLLVEMYLHNAIPPYGALKEPIPFPIDRCQPFLDFDVEVIESNSRKKNRVQEGESLDLLEKVDDELLVITRARIKKIYDEHKIIAVLSSGGKDSRLVTQLMIEHAIEHPDSSKRLMLITADTLVENVGVKSIIYELRDALAKSHPWIEYHIVEPKEDNTLLVCIIGKGYQSPSSSFKYCVRRLKIEPARTRFS